jgi:esterase
MDLFYRVRGEGKPLLLIHGLFGSADNLGGLARIFEVDHKVIVVDLRNHGRSPHADTMGYSAMAGDVRRVLDKEGDDSALVFGHSMGGKTAMQLALDSPDRVEKLVVADIAPVQYGAHHGKILEGMRTTADAAPEGRKGAESILKEYESEPAILSFLLTNWRKGDDGKWGWRLNFDAIERDYPSIAAGNEGKPYTGDTLFLRGELSDYVQAEHREQILNLFPKAAVRTIGGTGHWLHAEKPDMVARAIQRFFKG